MTVYQILADIDKAIKALGEQIAETNSNRDRVILDTCRGILRCMLDDFIIQHMKDTHKCL